MKSSTRNIIIATTVIVIIGVAGGWLVFNGQQGESNTSSASTSPTPSPTANIEVSPTTFNPSPTAVAPTGATKSFTVNAQNYTFSPQTLTVNQGDTVRITLKSVGGTHDLVIDDFNAKTDVLNGGQEQTIEFVANKTGSFEYYCSVSNHRAMGMTGTLVVQ